MLLSLGKLVSINSICFSINKSNLSTAVFFGGGAQEVKQIQSIPACQGIKKVMVPGYHCLDLETKQIGHG